MTTSDDWQSNKTLTECLHHLLTSAIAADVTFVLGEGREVVYAHKTILISRSPVFYAMFQGPMYEKGEIHIPDFDKTTFSIFLRYLYTDQLDFNEENIAAVMMLAEKYMVDKLTEDALASVEENATSENIFFILEEAHSYQQHKLRKLCCKIIAKNAHTYLKLRGFEQLCQSCVRSLTEMDEMNVKEEEEVYMAVIRWANAECVRQNLELIDENRRFVLADVIHTVRFSLMDVRFLTSEVCTTDILNSDEIRNAIRSCAGHSSDSKPRERIQRPKRMLRFLDVSSPLEWSKKTTAKMNLRTTKNAILHGICIYGCCDSPYAIKLTNVSVTQDYCIYKANHNVRKLAGEDKVVDVLFNNPLSLEKDRTYKLDLDIEPSKTFYGINEKHNLSESDDVIIKFSNRDIYNDRDTSLQLAGLLLSGV